MPVFDERSRKIEKCEMYVAWRSAGQTEWVACFKVAGQTVIKMDTERRDKLLRPPVEDDKKGRLNSRKPVKIESGVPHWRVIDSDTGELSWEHCTNEDEFPRGMSVHEAIPKFFEKLVNISWPTGVTFFRDVIKTGKREKLTMKTLFD